MSILVDVFGYEIFHKTFFVVLPLFLESHGSAEVHCDKQSAQDQAMETPHLKGLFGL